MQEEEAGQHPPAQPYQALLQHHSEQQQNRVVQFPKRRSTPIGYLVCPPLMGIALLITYTEQVFEVKHYISGGLFSLVAIIIAFLWGVGPALFAILLGFLTHYFFVMPFYGSYPFESWSDAAMYGPWLSGQLVVTFIVAQRERARQRAIVTEREAHARELTHANQALVQSNQLLEQLNHHVERVNQLEGISLLRASHELKTPITTIRGQAQLALRRIAKSPQAVSELSSLRIHLEKIDAQTHQLHALVEDLLDMSSLSSGKIPLRYAPCDLGNLCREIVENQHMLSDRHITLDLPANPVMIQADSQRLTQVIINLVSNAVKYSPDNMIIKVAVSCEVFHALLTVHNDHPPIPQEQCLHLFEAFYRAPEAQRSSIRGWGIGLAISKEIVERHTGQIWVESSQANGTTFFVRLPRQAHEQRRAETQ